MFNIFKQLLCLIAVVKALKARQKALIFDGPIIKSNVSESELAIQLEFYPMIFMNNENKALSS